MTTAQITLADVPAFAITGGAGNLCPDRTRRETSRARDTSELRQIHNMRAVSRRNMHTEAQSLATVEPGDRFKSPCFKSP